MKPDLRRFSALLLLAAAAQAVAADRELCRAGYPIMLMTEGECQSYLEQRKSLHKTGDMAGLHKLDAQMHLELNERAIACPCTEDAPVKLALSPNDGC